MLTAPGFIQKKKKNEKISVITCYDASMAAILAESEIDAILVGDSAAMVFHGFDSTVHADLEMMVFHTAAVRRGAPDAFIIADMPFLSHRKGKYQALNAAGELVKAGANAVKLEGEKGHAKVVEHIVRSGIPVMGHLGLTPQYVNNFGGYRIQGKTEDDFERLKQEALSLQEKGCFAIVAEGMPEKTGAGISKALDIPIIGIGAGRETDGQVLVIYDMLGITLNMKPRFVRNFMNGAEDIKNAVNAFSRAIKSGEYPGPGEIY